MEQKRDLVLCGCGWEESPWYIKDRADGKYYHFGTSVLKIRNHYRVLTLTIKKLLEDK